MSKSITQDMAYRQSLMKYAEKYGVSRASRKYNKSRSYIYFWKARWDGSAGISCLPVQDASQPSQPAHRGRAEADPGYAPPESQPGHGGTVAPAAPTGLYPPSGESVPGHAENGPVSAAENRKQPISPSLTSR